MSIVAAAVGAVGGIVLSLFFGTQKGPTQKLGEIAQQTAKEGEPRQIVFGIVRPIGGNIVAVQEPPRIERRKQKSGGKGGGGGSSSTIEVARRTYAVGICEGPITGIRRAWRNNKLVYDGRGTEWGAKNNGTFLSTFQFYLGNFEQLPSPNLEAVFGVGQVPAMRGTCYMVAKDEDLGDTGGALPQWIFEVERAYGYGLTSRPYPVQVIESSDAAPPSARPSPSALFADVTDAAPVDILSGAMRSTLVNYADWPIEATDAGTVQLLSGEMRQILKGYTDWPIEATDAGTVLLIAGSMKPGRVNYERYPTEATNAAPPLITQGTMS
jgi:hypothetical protein